MGDLILLLRGINVGGIRIQMSDLKLCLEGADFAAVRTYLQTGNVRLQSNLPLAEVVQRSQDALRERFKYEAVVFGLTYAEFERIIDGYPWNDTPEGIHRYVIFGSDPALVNDLAQAATSILNPPERVQQGTGAVYWEVPKGSTTETPMAKLLAQSRFRAGTTTRNLNTLARMR